jgi:hypothetical protein
LLGRTKRPWQAVTAVLQLFGSGARAACAAYRQFVADSSHRAAPARGRALFCRWAVVDLGVSSNVVARFLGVTRQSVRRALERCDHVFGEIECSPE